MYGYSKVYFYKQALLTIAVPIIAFSLYARDYETKSFTTVIEETLAFRDTQEEVRQIAWLKAKLQVADMVEEFLSGEFGLDEVVPDEGARIDLKKAAEMGNKQAKDLLKLLP